MFISTWFSSAQSFFITKFLVNFSDKIRRAHISFGKIQYEGETEPSEENI